MVILTLEIHLEVQFSTYQVLLLYGKRATVRKVTVKNNCTLIQKISPKNNIQIQLQQFEIQ